MKKLISYIVLTLFLSGCSLTIPPKEKNLTTFLKNGWDFYIYQDKVILIRKKENGEIEFLDFFGVLNSDTK